MKKIIRITTFTFLLTLMAGFFSQASAQTTVKQETKTGWSGKKKGAVIGGGVGAVTGAAVSKKHAKGAVVGGAVGAGAGYLYGRHRDKKHPKKVYKYKKTVQ